MALHSIVHIHKYLASKSCIQAHVQNMEESGDTWIYESTYYVNN